MTITLTPETQRLLEDRMLQAGISNPDQMVREALLGLDEPEDRSTETLAAIERGLAQARAGQTLPWEDVKKELMARHP